jgi:hypothetical protein
VLETDSHWKPFASGSSLGKAGSEGGVIVRDEEFASSARITLEQSCARLAITCGVYGWMVHTRFFATRATAERELDNMKSALQSIVSSLPDHLGDDEATRRTNEALNTFVERYPT